MIHWFYRMLVTICDRRIERLLLKLKFIINTRSNMYWPHRKSVADELARMADVIYKSEMK